MDRDIRLCLYGLAHEYQGGHQKGGGVMRLAEDMGVSPSLLSRWISPFEAPDGETQRFIPAERLVQFCRLTGSAAPLEHLAAKLGLLLYKVPGARKRGGEDLRPFMRAAAEASQALLDAFHPAANQATQQRVLKSLDTLMREAASYRLAVQKHTPNQLHLIHEEEKRP